MALLYRRTAGATRHLHLSAVAGILARKSRNIRVLHNFKPLVTEDALREAALQFDRKVSGSTHHSRANADAFEQAVDEIARATQQLLDGLVMNAVPKIVKSKRSKDGSATCSGRIEKFGIGLMRSDGI